MTTLRVAAIQMCARVADTAHNLAAAEALARQAFRHRAQWVILPEFFASAVAYTPAMLGAWQPLDGPALALMRRLAREHEGVVGGSFIARDGGDCYNSFLLVFADGSYHRHDKDLPTMWENCYYIGGSDDGVLATPAGEVGVAMCWEMIRGQTPRRLQNRIGLLVGGSCWWDLRQPVPAAQMGDSEALHAMLREAPARLARMLRVPVIHASHAGRFEGRTPGNESKAYASRYLGETQITDGEGNVLARMSCDDGEGIISAAVDFGRVPGEPEPIPAGFWMSELPAGASKGWEQLNSLGRAYYRDTFRPSLDRPPNG